MANLVAADAAIADEDFAAFGQKRAEAYERQIRIAMAGYDACHELAGCMLSAAVADHGAVHVLCVGAGGGGPELLSTAQMQPTWRFTVVDPSEPMLEVTRRRITEAGLAGRTTFVHGVAADVAASDFDGATLMGVLHHIHGREAKVAALAALSARLRPGAPLVLSGNIGPIVSGTLLFEAWRQRFGMKGVPVAEADATLARIVANGDPPQSEADLAGLLCEAGFEPPLPFFSSLFWRAVVTRRMA